MIDITDSLIRLHHAVKQQDAIDGYELETVLELARNQARIGIRQAGWADGLNRFVRLVEHLLESPTAESLLVHLAARGLRLKFEPLGHYGTESDALYNPADNMICLAQEHLYMSKAYEMRLVSLLAHQLRRAWQFDQGFLAEQNNCKHITDFARHYRNEEADAGSIAILIAWELRLAERPQCWRDWIAGADGDMALAFSDRIERKPISQFDGTAIKAAYETWFSDFNRLEACDDRALLSFDSKTAQECGPRFAPSQYRNETIYADYPENIPENQKTELSQTF